MRRRRQRRIGIALLLLALGVSGCATWRGARLYQSGSRALERGEVDRALTDLAAASALVPGASEVHNHLGIAQLEAGRDAEALASFEEAVRLDCDNRAAADNLADLKARAARAAAIEAVSSAGSPGRTGEHP
jgi:Flp pilus assembly protein TadD